MRLKTHASEIGLEVIGVKILRSVTGDGWWASVTVRVTEEDGKVARGWVDVRPRGSRLVLVDWDSSDASDIGFFGQVVQAETPAILDAVNAKIPPDNRTR